MRKVLNTGKTNTPGGHEHNRNTFSSNSSSKSQIPNVPRNRLEDIPISNIVKSGKEYGKCQDAGISIAQQVVQYQDDPRVKEIFTDERIAEIKVMCERSHNHSSENYS